MAGKIITEMFETGSRAVPGFDPDCGFRSYGLTAESYNEEERSIEGIAATENVVRVFDFARMAPVNEVLLMDGLVDQLPKHVPLIDTHRADSVDNVIGSSILRREGDHLVAHRTFAKGDPKADRTLAKVRDKHLRDGSIRYRHLEQQWVEAGATKTVAGRSFSGPVNVVTKWMVQEDSIAPIGADPAAKMRSEASASPTEPLLRKASMNEEMRKRLEALGLRAGATDEEAMAFLADLAKTKAQPPAAPAAPAPTPDEIRARAIADERTRTADIEQYAAIADQAELGKRAILAGDSAEKARAAIYDAWKTAKAAKPGNAPAFAPAPQGATSRLAAMDSKAFARSLCEMTPIEVDGGGLSINSMRQIAKSEPKAWADKMRAAIEAKDLDFTKIAPHLKEIQQALHGVMVEETLDDPITGKRALTTAAFPVLCGNTIVAKIQDGYNSVPTIGEQLVEEMDADEAITRVASILTPDSKLEDYREGEAYPLLGASEEWSAINEKPMGRMIQILQTTINRHQGPIVARMVEALGKSAKNWVEEITLSRVCDQYGSAGSASEPYVYRPKGTGATLYSASANTPGTRAPSGTSVASNALADYTDLDAARAVLVAMKDENGKRIAFSWNDIILLVPDAIYYIALRNLGSEFMPVADTTFNSATLNHWGPRGAFRPTLLSSPKLDDISASTWFIGNFKKQFIRKWAKRFQYMTLGETTESMLQKGIAFQASMSWNMEVGCTDYVSVVRSTS